MERLINQLDKVVCGIDSKAYDDLNLEDRRGEYWKDIPNYEGLFMISNHGRIKRLAGKSLPVEKVIHGKKMQFSKTIAERIFKQTSLLRCGRLFAVVNLTNRNGNKRLWTVHKLMSVAFGISSFSFYIRQGGEFKKFFKNGDTLDNRLENLQVEKILVSKKCSTCNKRKAISEFGKMSIRKDGISASCKECVNSKSSNWCKNNPDNYKKIADRKNRKMVDSLSDGYVKARLRKNGFSDNNIEKYPELVTVKRSQIKIKRKIKNVCQ
jgi:hypothetical protein